MTISFDDDVQAFYDESVRLAADGLTVYEAGLILSRFVSLCVRSAFRLSNPGPEKKALVMKWISDLLDKLIPALPMPWNWLAYVAKNAILNYISAQVEEKYEELKRATLPPAPKIVVEP